MKKDSSKEKLSNKEENNLLLEKYRILPYDTHFQLKQASTDVFRTHRKNNIRIYAYTNHLITQLTRFMEDSNAAYALFDSEGYLLKVFGAKDTIEDLAESGIKRGTIWSFNTSGQNAVSIGLAEKKTVYSFGDYHSCEQLKPYALYFSPIIVSDDFNLVSTPDLYGGLAIIVPVQQHNPDYCFAVYAAVNDLALHIYSGNLNYKLYENTTDALLSFDISMLSGKISTVYHSKNIFDVFGIDPVDIYFKPAEEFIEPLPQNKEFWDIIINQKSVQDKNMTISIHGKKVTCVITTVPYRQSSISASGVRCLITSTKQISSNISKHVGNGAIRTFDNIIGYSSCIKTAIQKGRRLAASDSNIMLLGESGTGKDVFAQAMHNIGYRKDKPFITVNCGALPRDLIASELFGYEPGAFTGAKKQGNLGKFELANGGTLFLDEIGELPLDLQATLLRSVEQKKIFRIGGRQEIDIDVRIITATNVDIRTMVEQKKFRADLYYRLSTLRLNIPPLRERGEDIVILAEYFIKMVSDRINRRDIMQLSDEAKNLLKSLPWVGNVRELQNLIERIVQLYPDSVIETYHILNNTDLPNNILNLPSNEKLPVTYHEPNISVGNGKKEHKLLTEKDILDALSTCHGNRSAAAKYLGIARRTLYNKMNQFGITYD